MKTTKGGLIIIGIFLMFALICISFEILEISTVRDVILAPALVIVIFLIFKNRKNEKFK